MREFFFSVLGCFVFYDAPSRVSEKGKCAPVTLIAVVVYEVLSSLEYLCIERRTKFNSLAGVAFVFAVASTKCQYPGYIGRYGFCSGFD